MSTYERIPHLSIDVFDWNCGRFSLNEYMHKDSEAKIVVDLITTNGNGLFCFNLVLLGI